MSARAATARAEILPASLPPRALSRTMAAAYLSISPALFDAMVKDGRMPSPKIINSRLVWDRKRLDTAFDALPERDGGGGADPDDDGWADWN